MKSRTTEENALIYVCGLIEEIGRETKNERVVIVNILSQRLQELYDYSDVYHCDDITSTATELIDEYNIPIGTFDNVATCKYRVPTSFEIGRVMAYLILMVIKNEDLSPVEALIKIYRHKITKYISNFNSADWFSPTEEQYSCYKNDI